MALGGGTYTSQNKVLPGAYINFVSAASADTSLSERGIATMPLELDWGIEGEVFAVTNEDFRKNSLKIFGYDHTHEKLKGLRDLFRNIHTLYAYRINTGAKAANDYAQAKYGGIRGNDLKISIRPSIDVEDAFEVITMLESFVMDEQVVKSAAELTDNDYVDFKKESSLAAIVSMPLTGGTNGVVDGDVYQSYLNRIESYTYNTMGVVTEDETVKNLFAAFNRRLRDEMGIKAQLVIFQKAADYMGVVNVKNKVVDNEWPASALVYWVTGIISGCEVNKSNQNRKYDGEFAVDTAFTQSELEKAIKDGEFALHRVNSEIRVLADINSMVTTSDTCGEVFKENQTIRVIDQIANDDAVLFNTKYLGVVPNDAAGRISLWSDLVKIRQTLQNIRAIEDFKDDDVTVAPGESKKAVVVDGKITVVNAMAQLYMTTTVG